MLEVTTPIPRLLIFLIRLSKTTTSMTKTPSTSVIWISRPLNVHHSPLMRLPWLSQLESELVETWLTSLLDQEYQRNKEIRLSNLFRLLPPSLLENLLELTMHWTSLPKLRENNWSMTTSYLRRVTDSLNHAVSTETGQQVEVSSITKKRLSLSRSTKRIN